MPVFDFSKTTENKKEAVEYLKKLGYNATMKNVHLLHEGQW